MQIFEDDYKIHQWANESVYYMANKELLKGVGVNEFNPLGLISREQSIVISARMVEEIFKNKLKYFPENTYTKWQHVDTVAEVKDAFKYAKSYLLPSISLTLNAQLVEDLDSKYSDILNKMEIEKISISYFPGTYRYTFALEYSLFAEVKALMFNEDIDSAYISSQAQVIESQLLGIIDSLISPEMNYYQREKAIHDYIVKNYHYDLDKTISGKVTEESHCLVGLLENGKGVCDGYSQLFAALCLNTKIPCRIVYGAGEGGSHAWNIVELYGETYHVDVTWDDPIPDKGLGVKYTYFNVSDEFMQKDHQWDNDDYPSCDFVTYSYEKMR